MVKLLFITLTFLTCLATIAQNIENFEVRGFNEESLNSDFVQDAIQALSRPSYLFHWYNVNRMMKTKRSLGPSSLKRLQLNMLPLSTPWSRLPKGRNTFFSTFMNSDKRKMYFWTHPVAGMGINEVETYVNHDSDNRLIVVRPKKNARISIYVSDERGIVRDDSVKALETDIVIHIRAFMSNVGVRIKWIEWVLLNEKAIDEVILEKERVGRIVDEVLNEKPIEKLSKFDYHSTAQEWIHPDYQAIIEKALSKNRFEKRLSTLYDSCMNLLK